MVGYLDRGKKQEFNKIKQINILSYCCTTKLCGINSVKWNVMPQI